MLIEFTVGNFLSFNTKRTLSFEAKSISELKQNIIRTENNYKLLPSIVIYGANSSGKSNVIKALDRMRSGRVADLYVVRQYLDKQYQFAFSTI